MLVDAAEQPDDDLAIRLDRAFDRAAAASSAPGAQAAVVRDGVLVWSGSYGLADVETATPISDRTVFCLASLGKTLLAALALRLVEEGTLALDAPLAAVVGNLVPGAEVVTIRMLLTHTAGYPDLYAPEVMASMPPEQGDDPDGSTYDSDRPFTWEMLAVGVGEPIELGMRWEYSNTGYITLCEVVTRALAGTRGVIDAWTGLAHRAGGDVRLGADLLTMERSAVDVACLAHGYEQQVDGSYVDPYARHQPSGCRRTSSGPFGDGLFAGTAVGTALFLDALFVRRSLLDTATVDQMTAVTVQAAAADAPHPDLNTYAIGTFQMSVADGQWQGHRGRYGGFSAVGASRSADGSTLVVLTNCMTVEPPALVIWRELAGTV